MMPLIQRYACLGSANIKWRSSVAAFYPQLHVFGKFHTPVGPEGSFSVSVCIDTSTSIVEMVSTDNQSFGSGLEFDEAMTITVTRPDSSSASQAFTSFQECVPASTVAAGSTTPVDISSLFQDGGGAFICGIHAVDGTQCNSAGRWGIRSFDIVVS